MGKHWIGPLFLAFSTFLCSYTLIEAFGVYPAFAQIGEALENPQIGEVFENAKPSTTRVNDPLEKTNREVFKLNDKIYFWAMKPAATAYSATFPEKFRTAVKNASVNFVFPARYVNCMLQHKEHQADIEMVRFVINSTLGLGGLLERRERLLWYKSAPQSRFRTNSCCLGS